VSWVFRSGLLFGKGIRRWHCCLKESYRILGACFEVYKENGCGFLEPVYQECLVVEFDIQSVPFQQQVELVLNYKGRQLVQHYGPDFICFGPSDNYEAERNADEVAAGGATTEDTECTEKVGEDLLLWPLGSAESAESNYFHPEPKQERVLGEGKGPFSVFRVFRGHLI